MDNNGIRGGQTTPTAPERELLTVSQFAERTGVKRQSVYKRLSTSLSTYVVKVDNKTYLDYTAYSSGKGEGAPEDSGEMCQPCQPDLSTPLSTPLSTLTTPEVDTLTARIAELEAALDAERAARIAEARQYADDVKSLNDTALELIAAEQAARAAEAERHSAQIADLTRQLDQERAERREVLEALRAAQQLQHEAQALHALTAAPASPDTDPPETAPTMDDEPEPERVSFFKRIFKKGP